jgi:hypothetical protein
MSKEVNPIEANTHRQYIRLKKADPEFSSNAKTIPRSKAKSVHTTRAHFSKSTFYNQDPL